MSLIEKNSTRWYRVSEFYRMANSCFTIETEQNKKHSSDIEPQITSLTSRKLVKSYYNLE